MKLYLVILLIFTSLKSFASWVELNIEEAVCSSTMVFAGSYESIEETDYFLAAFPSRSEKYWYDLGSFKVDQVLKNNKKITHYDESSLLQGIRALVDGKCEGGFCHMTLPKTVGEIGIWLVSSRHQHSGSFMLLSHPSNPLPLSEKAKVEEYLRSCPQ